MWILLSYIIVFVYRHAVYRTQQGRQSEPVCLYVCLLLFLRKKKVSVEDPLLKMNTIKLIRHQSLMTSHVSIALPISNVVILAEQNHLTLHNLFSQINDDDEDEVRRGNFFSFRPDNKTICIQRWSSTLRQACLIERENKNN